MYLSHFGLKEQPFSIAPDPSFLYLSAHHQEALGHLLYGAGQTGGFVALTGEVGAGKTTLVRTLLEQKLDNVDIALCLNSGLSVNDFVESLCDELGVAYPPNASLRQLGSVLNEALLASHAAGRHSVAIIDEAQNLSREVLEQIRLLTNLETNKDKLLRIILVGQPELRQLLARNDLRQLAQRITARYHLAALSRAETAAYVQHRLSVAGTPNSLFTARALSEIYKYSAGTPRLINILCDRALTLAYARESDQAGVKEIRLAAKELLPESKDSGWLPTLGLASCFVLLGTVAWLYSAQWIGDVHQQLFPQKPDVVAGAQLPSPSVPSAAVPSAPPAVLPPPDRVELLDEPQPIEPPIQPDSLSELFDYKNAVPDLLSRWQVAGTVNEAQLCSEVRQYQLRCLSGSAEIDEVIRFNRPTLLTLSQPGAIVTALLQAVDGKKFIFQTADGLRAIGVEQLLQYWTGEYQLLLSLPSATVFTIRPGQQNSAVKWLRQQVALYDGETPLDQQADLYDSQLKRRVERFQTAHGLDADGVVGGKTLTLLQNVKPAAGTPLLTKDEG